MGRSRQYQFLLYLFFSFLRQPTNVFRYLVKPEQMKWWEWLCTVMAVMKRPKSLSLWRVCQNQKVYNNTLNHWISQWDFFPHVITCHVLLSNHEIPAFFEDSTGSPTWSHFCVLEHQHVWRDVIRVNSHVTSSHVERHLVIKLGHRHSTLFIC